MRAVGRAGREGLSRRQHPRGVRRRRARHDRAGRGGRGARARRAPRCCCIVVSPAIAGSVLARHGTPEQKDRWLRGIGRGDLKIAFAITEPDAGTNTHNLQTKATTRNGGRTAARAPKVFISGVEDADALLVVARTGDQRADRPGPALAVHRRRRRPRAGAHGHPHRPARRRQAVAALLRRRRGAEADRLVGPEHDGPGGRVRRPEPRADHDRGAGDRASGAGRWPRRPSTRASAWCGARRSAPHQGVSHPLAEAQDPARAGAR